MLQNMLFVYFDQADFCLAVFWTFWC